MMHGVGTLARAMALGFVRDRIAVFFTILFPLIFLIVFGGIFKDQGPSAISVRQIGAVPLLDSLPPEAKAELDKVLKITKTDDAAGAIELVRRGDEAAAIEQRGDQLIVHYPAADAVRSATVNGVLNSLVQQSNLATTGVAPRYSLATRQVENESLQSIQYVTPGILGWAIASGATFGAAFTLVQWRKNMLLRRLRLSPVHAPAIAVARVSVSIVVALVQAIIFIGLARLPFFGLQLSNYWWMSLPVIVAGTLAFLSIGLLAGAVAKTEEAANLISNLVVLPMAFLSGAFIPLDFSPKWLQTLAEIFPLKHLVTAMQDVMVRGRGPESVLPEIGLLLAFAAVLSLIAMRAFRWDDA